VNRYCTAVKWTDIPIGVCVKKQPGLCEELLTEITPVVINGNKNQEKYRVYFCPKCGTMYIFKNNK